MPRYGGTLAAVRSLGRYGIPVTVAADELLAPARWSRHATRVVRCPPPGDAPRFLDWLLRFGEREPRHALYATSDDLAFMFAANAAELSKRFDLYQPAVESVVRVLDKKALSTACESVGLTQPPTWFPRDESDIPRIAREAPFPVLIKARTQVRRADQTKGVLVERPDGLLEGYRSFIAGHRYLPGLEPYFGEATQPMVQHVPAGSQRVYSISGFVDRGGNLLATRASVKVLQRTQPVGLGVCFETDEVDPGLAQSIARLCRAVGHFGVFEVEFVRDRGKSMVIDFNPRFFGQMGFDAARGLHLAAFAYHAARGDEAALRMLAAEAASANGGATIYTHRFIFEGLILAERFAGSLSATDYARWRQWYARNRGNAADASADRGDLLPSLVHIANEACSGLRALLRMLSTAGAGRRAGTYHRGDADGGGPRGHVAQHDGVCSNRGAVADRHWPEDPRARTDHHVVADPRIPAVEGPQRVPTEEHDSVADLGVPAEDDSNGVHEENSLSQLDVVGDLYSEEGGLEAADDAGHEGDARALSRLP